MDPQATLYELLSNIRLGDRDTAAENLEDLMNWLDSGGVLPQVGISPLTSTLMVPKNLEART